MWFYLHLANLILAWNSTKSAPVNGHYPKLLFSTYTWFSHAQSQFRAFEQDTQFSHTKIGNFCDSFKFLIEWHHFYTKIGKFPDDFMSWTRYAIFIRWIFCIFHVPCEKVDSTNQCSMLSLVRNNKKLKIAKKKTYTKFLQQHWCIVSKQIHLWYIAYLLMCVRGVPGGMDECCRHDILHIFAYLVLRLRVRIPVQAGNILPLTLVSGPIVQCWPFD